VHYPRILIWWYGLMGAGGFLFGLIGDRHPFGSDMLAHPLIVFFASAAAALLALCVVLARPLPELIPERPLIAGSLLGAAAFMVGNFITTRLLV